MFSWNLSHIYVLTSCLKSPAFHWKILVEVLTEIESWLCESICGRHLLKWVLLTWCLFLCLFYSYFYSSIFFFLTYFPSNCDLHVRRWFSLLPDTWSTKLSPSLHLVGTMVSCYEKVCCEIPSLATQHNIFLIPGDGQRSRWHIILSRTPQWNTKDEYSYSNASKMYTMTQLLVVLRIKFKKNTQLTYLQIFSHV